MTEYDSPWKEAMDHYFQRFLAFFFPAAHDDLDWQRDYEPLDTEFRKLTPAAVVGRRLVDKFVKAHDRANGEPVFVHVEVQGQEEADFPRRIYVYNYRAEDRYNQPVVSLVVLADERPDWRPTTYEFERWGCRKTFTFPVAKLLDYVGREEELEADANPFALLVLAHLQAQRTRHDTEARRAWKLRLIKNLYDRGLDADDLRQWYRFLDWLLALSPEDERLMWAQLRRDEEEKYMPFVTNAHRFGVEEGLRTGLQKAIELGLDLKFGEPGLELMPEVRKQTDPALLQALCDAIRPAATLDDVRRLLP